MDMNTWGPVLLALIAIVPTAVGLIVQEKRDAKQLQIEITKAANEATQMLTTSLREEISRLQTDVDKYRNRISELETAIITKTKEYGELLLSNIDKDSELRTMKYKMESMQRKLESVVPAKSKKKEDTVPLKVKQELLANEEMKLQILERTDKEVNELRSKSISNGIEHNLEEIGE